MAWLLLVVPSNATPIAGFAEPFRAVDVATTEMGIVRALPVEEGDKVKEGDLLAVLDDEVQQALLTIAKKNHDLRGRLEAARAECELRQERLKKLKSLHAGGHARLEEVERSRADLAIAEAQLMSAEEEVELRRLEYEKAVVQLQRRRVLSPLSGVVSIIYKQEGEFVAPAEPRIVRIVQLEKLLAVFSVPGGLATQLDVGMPVKVKLNGDRVPAVVEKVSPVTDAESDTVRIKVRIDNSHGKYRSGQRCLLFLHEPTGG